MVIKLPYMVIFPEFGLIFDEISVKFQGKAQKTLHKVITRLQSNHITIDYNQIIIISLVIILCCTPSIITAFHV